MYGKEDMEKMRGLLYTCLHITDPNDLGNIRAETLDDCIKSKEGDTKQ